MARDEVVVWRQLALAADERVCNYGHRHVIHIWVSKRLGPVVGYEIHDNGYEKNRTELRLDRQGRTYHKQVAIDYFNNISWLRLNDRVLFSSRTWGGGGNIDVLGRVL